MKKNLSEIYQSIENNKKNLEFIKTGFSTIDFILEGGFLRKELVVVGAQTGIGKSIFGSHFFYQASKQGFKSAYFSLEISNELIVSRLLAREAGLSPTLLMTGQLLGDVLEKKIDAKVEVESYESFMSFYDDTYVLEEIIKEIEDNNYDFVVIDFVQNVISTGEREYDKLSRVSLELQKAAKKYNCCILILSQLSNFASKNGLDSGNLEYKGTGNIATVCDLGLIIERSKETKDMNIIHLRKNRRGRSGEYVVIFYEHPGGDLHE
jgi:replicative DNA helicase